MGNGLGLELPVHRNVGGGFGLGRWFFGTKHRKLSTINPKSSFKNYPLA